MPQDKIDKLSAKLDRRFNKLEGRFDGLEGKFDRLENHFDRLTMKVIDMDHYMHTELATKKELADTKNELMTHIDGFITLHQKLDLEVVANRRRCDRIQEYIGMKE